MKQDLLNVISYLSTVIGALEAKRKHPPTDAETAVMQQLLIARENIRRVYVALPGAIQADGQGTFASSTSSMRMIREGVQG